MGKAAATGRRPNSVGVAASSGVQVSNPKSLTYCSLIVSPWFLSTVDNVPPAFLRLFPSVPFLVSGRSSQNGELNIVPRSLFLSSG
jgi:hypothetical protein